MGFIQISGNELILDIILNESCFVNQLVGASSVNSDKNETVHVVLAKVSLSMCITMYVLFCTQTNYRMIHNQSCLFFSS